MKAVNLIVNKDYLRSLLEMATIIDIQNQLLHIYEVEMDEE